MNEEQLMENLEKYSEKINDNLWYVNPNDVRFLLHQAELNWITAQIERGEELVPKGKSLHQSYNDGKRDIADDFLTPLIERKKELEDIIRNEKGL